MFSAPIPRLDSITSRAPRYTSQQTSNAISGFTLISPSDLFSSTPSPSSTSSRSQSVFPHHLLRHPFPPPLLDHPAAVQRLPQMSQLRRYARWGKFRLARQLLQRHPLLVPRRQAQHRQERLPLSPSRSKHPVARCHRRRSRRITRLFPAHPPPPPKNSRRPLRSPPPRRSDPDPRNPPRSRYTPARAFPHFAHFSTVR